MPRKRIKQSTQTVVFKLYSTVSKDLFLEFAMIYLKNKEFHLENKFEKIIFHIVGDRNEIKPIIEKLSLVEQQLNNAITGRNGTYIYNSELLRKMFQPHMKLSLYSRALSLYGYEVKLFEDALETEADYFTLKGIHNKLVDVLAEMPKTQHRDIQKFFALLVLQSEISYLELGNIAVEHGIMREIDGMYQFAMDQDLAYEKMSELMDKPIKREMIEIQEDEEFTMTDFFDGGKMIFIKNGEELDRSPFDIVDKQED
ncbi:MAG: DUF2067 family protein [Candidatus Heimdallarchaeota archaeon]|nr:DUF2067 family protein [Candidatus Heimdallarchaeota archaeon]